MLACCGEEIYHFCFVFTLYSRANFKDKPPRVRLYSEGRFNGGLLRYDLRGLIFGGACTWRGLFPEFYGIFSRQGETWSSKT